MAGAAHQKAPIATGKLKGELTASEIRKLIRAHNKLSQIKSKKENIKV